MSNSLNQVALTLVQIVLNNSLSYYGAKSIYGSEIPLASSGIIIKTNAILLAVIIGISQGAQPIIGFNYGSKDFARVRKAFLIAIAAAETIAVVCFFIFQFAPMSIVYLFGSEEGLYNEFAVKCFRIFLMLCPLNGFQTVAAIYLQAVGKPIKSAVVTLSRQIVFLIPVAIVMPIYIGVSGVLWSGPVADTLAFILSLSLIIYEMKQLKRPVEQTDKSEIIEEEEVR